MLRKDLFLALIFSLSSSMIFLLLYPLPPAVFFMLTVLSFGSPPPGSLLCWRLHKKLYFDWSAGRSTGVFLSIRANVKPFSSQSTPTKLTSNPISSHSTLVFVSIPLQLFLRSHSTAPFPFLSMYLRRRPSFFPRLKALRCISASSWGPTKQYLSHLYKAFLRPLLT